MVLRALPFKFIRTPISYLKRMLMDGLIITFVIAWTRFRTRYWAFWWCGVAAAIRSVTTASSTMISDWRLRNTFTVTQIAWTGAARARSGWNEWKCVFLLRKMIQQRDDGINGLIDATYNEILMQLLNVGCHENDCAMIWNGYVMT